MRKILLFLLFFLLFIPFSRAQYVTLEGRQFKDENGNDFYPVVCNYLNSYLYYPQKPDYFFPSPNHEHDDPCWDCTNLSECLEQYSANFRWLKEMNFNAIRLFGLGPIFYNDPERQPQGWAIQASDLEYALIYNCWDSSNYYRKAFPICPTSSLDNNLVLIFSYFDSVLVRAYKEDLKVILVPGGAVWNYSDTFPEIYATYLSILAHHIAHDSPPEARAALMAYDLFNEPTSSWYWQSMYPSVKEGHSKTDVCEHVSSWYDSIKQHDTCHLITFGGKPLLDLFEFDAGVLKIDFYSPHVYTYKRTYEGNQFFQGMVDQASGIFYWMANKLPMPYLIGEIGFRSKYLDDYNPSNEGTNAQQRDFADSALHNSRNCLSSGFSWWCYQDYYWGDRDCFHGILGWNPNTDTTEEKPVASVFRNFNNSIPPESPVMPDSYYDPFHHAQYAPGTNIITGHITFLTKLIKDALVFGQTFLEMKDEVPIYDNHYTFSDDNGNFELIPYDYQPPSYPNKIENLKITSLSGSRIYKAGTVGSGLTYQVNSSNWEYDGSITNCLVVGSSNNLQAFNTLELEDVFFFQGADADVKARTAIYLNSEVHANLGSKVHIYCTETFPDCNWIPDLLIKEPSMAHTNTTDFLSDDIEVAFLPSDDSVGIILYPNPCQNQITIEFLDPSLSSHLSLVEVFNTKGVFYIQFVLCNPVEEIDVSSLSPGLYLVKINASNQILYKKFIKK